MAEALKNIGLLIIAAFIGFGFALYLSPNLLPTVSEEVRWGIAVVLTLAAYTSLYFISKGGS